MSNLPTHIPAFAVPRSPMWSPVHPALLHKRSSLEVFLTDHADMGDEQRFRLAIPRAHSVVTDNQVPTILGVEAIRQVGLALCQVHGRVPADWALILQEASLAWTDDPPSWRAERLELEARCRIEQTQVRGEVMTLVSASTELLQDGRLVAIGGGLVRNLPRRAYQALRRRATTTTDHARPCGPSPLSHVVATVSSLKAVLGWSHPDPFFFDHPVDHVPGMLFAQAALDVHIRLQGRPALGIRLECSRFAELDAPVAVTARSDGVCCTSTFSQNGEVLARAVTRAG